MYTGYIVTPHCPHPQTLHFLYTAYIVTPHCPHPQTLHFLYTAYIVTPLCPHPQTLHFSCDNSKPYQIASTCIWYVDWYGWEHSWKAKIGTVWALKGPMEANVHRIIVQGKRQTFFRGVKKLFSIEKCFYIGSWIVWPKLKKWKCVTNLLLFFAWPPSINVWLLLPWIYLWLWVTEKYNWNSLFLYLGLIKFEWNFFKEFDYNRNIYHGNILYLVAVTDMFYYNMENY